MPEFEILTIESPPFMENCFVAWRAEEKDCVVVDPSFDTDTVVRTIQENGLRLEAILNTHGHADHIAGNAAMKQVYPDAPLIIGENDASKLTNPHENLSSQFGLGMTSPPADRLVREGERLSLLGVEWEVREIPGHSVGHVVFIWHEGKPPIVFGGDVLFSGSVGRTDFPDGDGPALIQGIREKLFTLPAETIILPGHGPVTTIGQEKETNPFTGERSPFG